MTRQEINELADYLSEVVDHIPRGANSLVFDALCFATFELRAAAGPGLRAPSYQQALTFAKSVPKFEDLDGADFMIWLMNDKEHLKYYPL